MKVKLSILLSVLLSSHLLMADNNITQEVNEYSDDELEVKMWNFSAKAGIWFIGWDQSSTASSMLQNSNDALKVNYNINNSTATTINFHVNYGMVSGNLKYYNNMNSKKDEKTAGASLGLSALDFVDNFSTEVRISKAEFDGQMSGAGATASGKATFDSDLEIMDFIIYPYNHYIGLGYRKYKYEFPQDLYLIRNSDNSVVPINGNTGGLANVEYKGHFYTLVADNQRLIDGEKNYQGFVYSCIIGVGKLTPNSQGFNEWMSESDAKFVDLSVGYTYNKLGNENHNLGLTVGYRYNQIETEATKTSGTHSLITEFKTKFHGPFIKLNYNY